MNESQYLTVSARVQVSMETAWEAWTSPAHIVHWNQASDDWHCPAATNDPVTGGKFSSTMAAKDGSFSFDFEGVYDEVRLHERIAYTMSDGRTVAITFAPVDDGVMVTEVFEAESESSLELQQGGWQAIMDSYKRYTESL